MESNAQSRAADVQYTDSNVSVLRDDRRRHVVELVSDRTAPIALSELAREVASRESDAESTAASVETADDVAVTLHHVHLPKLADLDVIEYDSETNVVTPSRTGAISAF